MLDLNFIKENKDKVKKAALDKNMTVDIDGLISLSEKRKDLITKIELLRAERKKLSTGSENAEKVKVTKKMLADLEPQLTEIQEQITELNFHVPNIPSDDTPIGKDERENVVVSSWGEKPKFDFKPKDHVALGKDLDILDLERGVKVSGFRGYYLKNEGAVLHLAVLMYAWEKLISKGYSPMIVPTLVKKDALIGSGQFPFGKEDTYQISNPGKLESGESVKDPLYLVGTAEPSLLAYRSNEMLNADELPLRFCGFSQCYRSEAGSYGKDTKGLTRVHEFTKIEQVIICKNDYKEADKLFEELRKNSEELLQGLNLPYQVLQICTGDMGAGKYKMNDIETWMAGQNAYRETHSNSHLTDWQTRRLNIRFKDKEGNKYYPFALNNTALASPRILIAILENNQQADGSVKIPEVLHKYTGFKEIKIKK